jgi:flagellar hook protein FlgE
MFGSIYSGYSGLLGFSKGLDVLSNNVANMNSPGFKASELSFRDLVYRYGFNGSGNGGNSSLQIGGGVDPSTTRVRFRQGETRETGNALDAAIDGNGFFVLRQDGKTFYSRAGQFEFDGDGFLVDQSGEARVAALNNGELVDINVIGLRNNPPQATSSVVFAANLSRGGTTHSISAVNVHDTTGASHALSMTFTNNNSTTSGSWLVEVRDESNAVIANGEIRFEGNGSPAAGFNTMAFSYTPNGASPSTITLNFGDVGSFSGSTNFSGGTTSDLRVQSQDGYAAGFLTEVSFDEDGRLVTKYSNAQTTKHERLALAWFADLQHLTQTGNNRFSNETQQSVVLDTPGNGAMGKLVPKKVELSNVELSEQFTDMVVIQRGYQASSQIISVANEMIQQLFDIRAKR